MIRFRPLTPLATTKISGALLKELKALRPDEALELTDGTGRRYILLHWESLLRVVAGKLRVRPEEYPGDENAIRILGINLPFCHCPGRCDDDPHRADCPMWLAVLDARERWKRERA